MTSYQIYEDNGIYADTHDPELVESAGRATRQRKVVSSRRDLVDSDAEDEGYTTEGDQDEEEDEEPLYYGSGTVRSRNVDIGSFLDKVHTTRTDSPTSESKMESDEEDEVKMRQYARDIAAKVDGRNEEISARGDEKSNNGRRVDGKMDEIEDESSEEDEELQDIRREVRQLTADKKAEEA